MNKSSTIREEIKQRRQYYQSNRIKKFGIEEHIFQIKEAHEGSSTRKEEKPILRLITRKR